jgi:hypothetical protein
MAGKKRVLIAAALVAVGVMVIGGVALANHHAMLEATLSGANEVNGAGVPNQGDTDGSGDATVRLIPSREKVCYTINVSGIAPATMAHIHKAPAGQNGPIFRALKAPTDGSSEGCARLSRMKIRMINNNPAGFYVNVHNGEFPNGALRGQLAPAGP